MYLIFFKKIILIVILSTSIFSQIPEKRIVAEWEPALGTMIRWPLGIPSSLVGELARDDVIYVLVETNNQQNQALNTFNNLGINLNNVIFIYTETYSHWTRDHGPQFIIGEEYWKVVNQRFNGYPEESGCQLSINNNQLDSGNNYEGRPILGLFRGWEEDDDTNLDFAAQMDWDVQNLPLYLTGGNFMTDGYGTGFSTELIVNENNLTESQFKDTVYEYLNIDTYHIFDNPNVSSIQHIDCLAKLVDSETIIIKQVSPSSPEYECIEDFANSFYSLNTINERPFEIHRILCPEINGGSWELNPVAAYTNSLILNNKVLVPQYGIPEDIQAIRVYEQAMPGYNVIGFNDNINNPWYSEDALHCRTMGVFDPSMMHIYHKSIRQNEILNNQSVELSAEIIDYGNLDTQFNSVTVHWKYSAEDGPFGQFLLTDEPGNIFRGSFPALNQNSGIDYFITATNSSGNSISHPINGWHSFITLEQIFGDVNADNDINVQDIILVVNIILNNLDFNQVADMNQDNEVNVYDIILIVNIILNR
ncbi:MAG: hypothetical protein CMG00_05710 [Candidatus Marinimicrobia bacterium]|nr:hypothetical protein [Candidatus Neomarinimicrobiota bacterium]|tara:strand:- start:2728 stop:4329 length:1602 start_codon:yes stop_codon:yes gene_type:complete